MADPEERTFRLAPEQASYIDALVAAGSYETGSAVVQAGLEALRDDAAKVERWLREEVVPVASAMQADPSRGIPADRVFENIRALHAERLRTDRRAV